MIRPAGSDDLPALTDIYNHYVVHSHATFDLEPFTVEQRRTSWFDHYADTGRHRLLVAENDGHVVGYATSGPFRPKAAYGGTVETTIYLHHEQLGRGIARRLYGGLLDVLGSEDGAHVAVAGIALPSPASVALHLGLGFRPVGTFTEVGCKFGRYFDVQWFQRPLT